VRHTYKLNIDTNELDKMNLMISARHSFGIVYSSESIYVKLNIILKYYNKIKFRLLEE